MAAKRTKSKSTAHEPILPRDFIRDRWYKRAEVTVRVLYNGQPVKYVFHDGYFYQAYDAEMRLIASDLTEFSLLEVMPLGFSPLRQACQELLANIPEVDLPAVQAYLVSFSQPESIALCPVCNASPVEPGHSEACTSCSR